MQRSERLARLRNCPCTPCPRQLDAQPRRTGGEEHQHQRDPGGRGWTPHPPSTQRCRAICCLVHHDHRASLLLRTRSDFAWDRGRGFREIRRALALSSLLGHRLRALRQASQASTRLVLRWIDNCRFCTCRRRRFFGPARPGGTGRLPHGIELLANAPLGKLMAAAGFDEPSPATHPSLRDRSKNRATASLSLQKRQRNARRHSRLHTCVP